MKRVRIADFRPEVGTIQKEQVEKVTEEFGRFLEAQFTDNEEDEDSLPMLLVLTDFVVRLSTLAGTQHRYDWHSCMFWSQLEWYWNPFNASKGEAHAPS